MQSEHDFQVFKITYTTLKQAQDSSFSDDEHVLEVLNSAVSKWAKEFPFKFWIQNDIEEMILKNSRTRIRHCAVFLRNKCFGHFKSFSLQFKDNGLRDREFVINHLEDLKLKESNFGETFGEYREFFLEMVPPTIQGVNLHS